MKKMIIFAIAALAASFVFADEFVTMKYMPDTNNLVTISGMNNVTMIPLVVYQEITGTQTNTATCQFITGGVTFVIPALTAVVGGSEAPQIMSSVTNARTPVAITAADKWTITGAGTAYSNITYAITYKLEKGME